MPDVLLHVLVKFPNSDLALDAVQLLLQVEIAPFWRRHEISRRAASKLILDEKRLALSVNQLIDIDKILQRSYL